MTRLRSRAWGIVLLLLPESALAQGLTSGTIQGSVRQADGMAIADATVIVVHVATGRRWQLFTGRGGGYHIEDAAIGGPYRVEGRAIGYRPGVREGMMLALGERLVVDLVLQPASITVAPVDVVAGVVMPDAIGPADVMSRDDIAALPNLGRDFLTLLSQTPHVGLSPSSGTANTGGITIGGQNRLYNTFQIDGGLNHDLYRGRFPGRESLARPISLEAIEELQVLVAPFDVRQATSGGGLINAVTRSGTNVLHGSVQGLAASVGGVQAGNVGGDYLTWQYGGTLSGPLVRDRAHFFLSFDLLRQAVPDPGPLITDTSAGADDSTAIGISYASALRFQTLLRDTFGLDPGSLGPVAGQVRTRDVFGKLSLQLGTNSHLEVSHHYTDGDRRDFLSRSTNFYFLSGFSQHTPSTVHASRLIWTAVAGARWSSELIVSALWLADRCRPRADFPQIRAAVGTGRMLVSGIAADCPDGPFNDVTQRAFEITGNVTSATGPHVLTLGAHAELMEFQDHWLQGASGTWNFTSLNQLQARAANRYTRAIPGPGQNGPLSFAARQFAVYAQDRWSASPRLTLTAGLRVDAARLPDPGATNTVLRDSLGIDTGSLPGPVSVSPRIGFYFRLPARGLVHGGVGLFPGRPPYQWLGNAYRDNGAHELFLDCPTGTAPPFDPAMRYTACGNGAGPVPRLSAFPRGVALPRNLRLALGAEYRLPLGIESTVDVLFTRAAQQLYFTDANLAAPLGVSAGEGNRLLYGTFTGAGNTLRATPARRVTSIGQVVQVTNSSGDQAFTFSVQLRRRFGRVEARAFYAFTDARDRMSLVNPLARQNLDNTALNGSLDQRPLRTSYFEIPHRLQVGGTAALPWQVSLALLYTGSSGTPFTYNITGDANADGIPSAQFSNDPVYVPRDSVDILLLFPAEWAELNTHIESEPCLRRQRGRVLERNSCRNPWFGTISARLARTFFAPRGHSLDVTADVYNVLNLLNSRWGYQRVTIRDPWVQMLALNRYDVPSSRGVYDVTLRGTRHVQNLASRWQAEIALRYRF